MTLKTIIETLPQNLPHKYRRNWTDDEQKAGAEWESKGVRVIGYLLDAGKQEAENCNCMSPTQRDFHLWFSRVPKPAGQLDLSDSVIVEISPRLLPSHPTWTLARLRQFADHGTRLRISGWLLWDALHSGNVDQTRATLWEIHPIHKIEFYQDGSWKEL
jgi:hypothetical protein